MMRGRKENEVYEQRKECRVGKFMKKGGLDMRTNALLHTP